MARSARQEGSGRLRAIRATAGGAWIRCASLSDEGSGPVESPARSGELIAPGQRLLVVADAGADEEAGERSITALRAAFHAGRGDLDERLRKGLAAAQHALMDPHSPCEGGVSLIALATSQDLRGCLARIGPMRAYRLRAGELSALGAESVDGARLGLAPDVEVEICAFNVRDGDHLVLGTGELSRLPAAEIARALALPGPFAAASRLIHRGRQLQPRRPMTVAVATLGDGAATTATPRAPASQQRSRRWGRSARAATLALALLACGLVADRLHTPKTADEVARAETSAAVASADPCAGTSDPRRDCADAPRTTAPSPHELAPRAPWDPVGGGHR